MVGFGQILVGCFGRGLMVGGYGKSNIGVGVMG